MSKEHHHSYWPKKHLPNDRTPHPASPCPNFVFSTCPPRSYPLPPDLSRYSTGQIPPDRTGRHLKVSSELSAHAHRHPVVCPRPRTRPRRPHLPSRPQRRVSADQRQRSAEPESDPHDAEPERSLGRSIRFPTHTPTPSEDHHHTAHSRTFASTERGRSERQHRQRLHPQHPDAVLHPATNRDSRPHRLQHTRYVVQPPVLGRH